MQNLLFTTCKKNYISIVHGEQLPQLPTKTHSHLQTSNHKKIKSKDILNTMYFYEDIRTTYII